MNLLPNNVAAEDFDLSEAEDSSTFNHLSLKLISERDRIFSGLGYSNKNFSSEFNLPGLRGYSATCISKNEKAQEIIGSGHSTNRLTASSKAIGEALERIFAGLFFSNFQSRSFDVLKLSVENRRARVVGKGQAILPPHSLQTSNGWSLHFTQAGAIKNALGEAIERSILQKAFLLSGWNGFEKVASSQIDGRQVDYLISHQAEFGFRGGITRVSLKQGSGQSFGYFIQRDDAKLDTGRLFHATMEAFEPAAFFDSHPDYRPCPLDELSVLQYRFASGQIPQGPRFAIAKSASLDTLEVNCVVMDCNRFVDIGFPLYVAYVFGGNLLPLIISSRLDAPGSQYLDSVFNYNDIPVENRHYETPII